MLNRRNLSYVCIIQMKGIITQDVQRRTEKHTHSYSLLFQEVYIFRMNIGHIVLIIDN